MSMAESYASTAGIFCVFLKLATSEVILETQNWPRHAQECSLPAPIFLEEQ